MRELLLWRLFFLFLALSSDRRSQRFRPVMSASRIASESGAAGDPLSQRISLENPDPQSNKRECVEETLLSDILESRYFFNVFYKLNVTDSNCHFTWLRW